MEKNYYLHQSAREAYRSFLLSYNSHQVGCWMERCPVRCGLRILLQSLSVHGKPETACDNTHFQPARIVWV